MSGSYSPSWPLRMFVPRDRSSTLRLVRDRVVVSSIYLQSYAMGVIDNAIHFVREHYGIFARIWPGEMRNCTEEHKYRRYRGRIFKLSYLPISHLKILSTTMANSAPIQYAAQHIEPAPDDPGRQVSQLSSECIGHLPRMSKASC